MLGLWSANYEIFEAPFLKDHPIVAEYAYSGREAIMKKIKSEEFKFHMGPLSQGKLPEIKRRDKKKLRKLLDTLKEI